MINNDDIGLEIDEFGLEQLIIDGADARIPLEIEFPFYKDGELTSRKYGVMIRPIKSSELNNATQRGLTDDATDVNTEIVKIGLCKKNGEPYSPEVVEKLPAGVINKLVEKIFDVSGIQTDKEAGEKYMREMMGF